MSSTQRGYANMGKNRKTQRKNGVEQGIPGRIGNVCTTKAGGIEGAVREEVKGTEKKAARAA